MESINLDNSHMDAKFLADFLTLVSSKSQIKALSMQNLVSFMGLKDLFLLLNTSTESLSDQQVEKNILD